MSKVRALLIGTLTAVSAMLAMYVLVVRRWILRWGATKGEAQSVLPGDEVVSTPRYHSTRAITITAPAPLVWPWLVQMGQGRGGLYSYDWLENLFGLDLHSADEILPEFQSLAGGDKIRLIPEKMAPEFYLEVVRVEPDRALVLRSPGDPVTSKAQGYPVVSWAFVLQPLDEARTRLFVRWRSDYEPTLTGQLVNQYLIEPVHFFMEQKQMRGIKQRAERLAQQTASV